MTKTLIAATLAAAFALTTFQSDAFARGGRHHGSSFQANGGAGGS
jgi:hypothetical protein